MELATKEGLPILPYKFRSQVKSLTTTTWGYCSKCGDTYELPYNVAANEKELENGFKGICEICIELKR